MAFSKVKTESIADSGVTTAKIANDAVVASKVDDDGTGFTVGNLTSTSTVTLGSGGTNWTLPTARGTDKYVLQINGTTGASTWVESLVAPEISSHSFDVSGSTDDGGINDYEAPYAYTGTTTNASTTISSLSSTTGLKVGQYISGAGIPTDTTISSIGSGSIVISNQATAAASGVALKIQKTPGEKNGGKVTLTGTNFGVNVGDISVAITTSGGSVIANASYLSGLSATSVTAEWTGTEGSYSTDLTSSYDGKIYFKITKSGLASNVYDSNTTLTTDATLTTLTTSSQTGGDRFATPSATSLGSYGGRNAGGAQDSNTKLLLNFDRLGGTDIEDSSNTGDNGHKVIATNAVIKASPFGDGKSAMFFDGSNDYLTVADSSDFDFGVANAGSSSAWTMECWFKETVSISNGASLFYWSTDSSSTDNYFQLYYVNATPKLYFNSKISGGTATNIQSDTTLEINKWYHVALVCDGAGGISMYLNGKLEGTSVTGYSADLDLSSTSSGSSGLKIGARKYGSTVDYYMGGYIDEIRIVKGTAVYTGDFTVPTSRLSTTWGANPYGGSNTVANSTAANTKLLIHSNQQITDSSSNNTTIRTYGNAGVTKEETNRGSGAHANFGSSAIYMDGTGDYLSFPISSDFAAEAFGTPSGTDDDFTIEGWYRFGTVGADQGLWGIHGDAEFGLYFEHSDDKLTLRTRQDGVNSGNSVNQMREPWSPSINTWYHVAVVRVGTTTRMYVDGAEVGSGTTNNLPPFSEGELFEIGTDAYSTRELQGHVDSFRISKMAVYTGAFTKPTSALTTTWAANVFGGSNTAANSTASNVIVLIQGDGGAFTDSATSGTTHTITPTGSLHTQGHEGIATAMTWPASGKSTGSSGVYFDGTGDYLSIGSGHLPSTVTQGSIDCWVYPLSLSTSGSSADNLGSTIMGKDNVASHWYIKNDGAVGFHYYNNSSASHVAYETASGLVSVNSWTHLAIVFDTNYAGIFVNGYLRKKDTTYKKFTFNSSSNGAACFIGINYSSRTDNFFHGYIDSFRIVEGANDWGSGYSGWSESSSTQRFTPPTKIYGAYGEETPDAGTVTLVATGAGDYTWSEMSAGTALPGSLAVGSTTHSGSGDSRTHTATITGSFSEDTSNTFTNGTRSDISTNNILLKAQNDADSTKAITLGSSGGYDGIGITQKSTEKPVLFSARRYVGNQLQREHSGYGFQPDLIWTKNRTTSSISHMLVDSVRGLSGTGGGAILSDSTASADGSERITQITSDGWKHKAGSYTYTNTTDASYIAWAWKAGGSPSGSALSLSGGVGAGTISSGLTNITNVTQSVNQNTGLSITKFRGAANGGSFPHNLGGTPSWVIVKQLTSGVGNQNWSVWHKNLSATTSKLLFLNTGAVEGSTTGYFDYSGVDMGSNTTLISIGSNDVQGGGAVDYICYAWRAISGVSAFGVYTGQQTGNPSSSDPTYCGFKPSMVILKKRDGSTGSWHIFDKFRSSGDTWTNYLKADDNGTETTSSNVSVTAQTDGFSTGSDSAITGNNIIWMAFA